MEPGPLRTTRGLAVVADRSLASIRGPIDTLVVVGGEGAYDASTDGELVTWVQRAARRSRRVASVCTGAFVLAAAGLLDGRRATTHWAWCDDLARKYPERHGRPRSDLRARRQRLDVGRCDRGHGPRARARRRRSRPRRRADDRAPARAVRATARAGSRSSARSSARRSRRGIRCAICSTGSSNIPTKTTRSSGSRRAGDEPAPLRAGVPRRGRLHAGRLRRAHPRRGRAPPCSRPPTSRSTRSPAPPASARPRRLRRAFARRVGTSPSEYRDRFRPAPGPADEGEDQWTSPCSCFPA